MKKALVSTVLATALVLSMTACGDKKDFDRSDESDKTAETTVVESQKMPAETEETLVIEDEGSAKESGVDEDIVEPHTEIVEDDKIGEDVIDAIKDTPDEDEIVFDDTLVIDEETEDGWTIETVSHREEPKDVNLKDHGGCKPGRGYKQPAPHGDRPIKRPVIRKLTVSV